MEENFNLGNMEYLILNYALKDRPFWLKVFENIKPKYFEKETNKKIFQLFKGHFAKYNDLPDIDIAKNELGEIEDGFIDAIYDKEIIDSDNKKKQYIYDNTLRFIKESMMTDSLRKSIELMENGKFDEIGEEIKKVLTFNLDTSLGVALSNIDERYEKIAKLQTDRVSTGFPQVDSILHGGWARKELYSVAAPPGVGKCQTYDTEVEIEIEEDSEIYNLIKNNPHEDVKWGKIRAKIKIGDLVEALGAKTEKQEVDINNYNIKINTPYGFKKVNGAMKTEELPIVNIRTNNSSLDCATRHRVETKNGFDFVTNAKEVRTKNGFEECEITNLNKKENCYDIQVSDVHSYWSNNIHSHNSIFLANWAVNAVKQGYNALVYTLEISEERLSMRHDAIFTKIPVDELALDIDKLKKKYAMLAKTTKANLWIKEFPTKSSSINHLKAHHEQLMLYEDFKPDVILVDYAGLLRPSYRTGDGYEDLKTIYEDLRGWAGELDVPIITASQTNRKSLDEKGGTKEIITQAQVSESLGITQTLDVFMTISQSSLEKEDGLINLYFDKHRNGESSKMIKFDIDYKNFILDEVEI